MLNTAQMCSEFPGWALETLQSNEKRNKSEKNGSWTQKFNDMCYRII